VDAGLSLICFVSFKDAGFLSSALFFSQMVKAVSSTHSQRIAVGLDLKAVYFQVLKKYNHWHNHRFSDANGMLKFSNLYCEVHAAICKSPHEVHVIYVSCALSCPVSLVYLSGWNDGVMEGSWSLLKSRRRTNCWRDS